MNFIKTIVAAGLVAVVDVGLCGRYHWRWRYVSVPGLLEMGGRL